MESDLPIREKKPKYDMCKVFPCWGKVSEVFISRKLERWGHMYGFVRFYDVRHVQKFKRDLDSISIGSTKLYVNTPKFEREARMRKGQQVTSVPTNNIPKIPLVWREVKRQQSYAHVVKASPNNSTNTQQLKGIAFETKEADVKWLEGCYIGRVNNCINVRAAMEEIAHGGLGRKA